MTPHLDIAVAEPSQVGEARRAAARLAGEHGFDELVSGRLALVVTELGNNLARHARGGRLLIGARGEPGARLVEVLSLDTGPGMADVDRCLRDGFSTGATPGTGFGAVRRLSTDFSVFSRVGQGTVILSRLRETGAPPRGGVSWAGVCLAAPGETVSGDAWAVRESEAGVAMVVADGLGHGSGAAEAADAMVSLFLAGAAAGSPAALLERAHPALRGTRGAAVAIAALDPAGGRVLFAGAGNIAGRLISGVEDRSLLSQHGTLGVQIRRLQDTAYAWPEHAIVVLHSDGITTRWHLAEAGALLQCDPAVIAAWILRDHLRGRDDATVVVLKKG